MTRAHSLHSNECQLTDPPSTLKATFLLSGELEMGQVKSAVRLSAFTVLAGLLTVQAQTPVNQPPALAAVVIAAPAADSLVVPDGTEFNVVNQALVSSKTATEGDPVDFKVDADVLINGVVVIAKGTLVKGEVTNAEHNGHFGKSGKLSIRVSSTTSIDGQQIKLRAARGKSGSDATGSTVALTVLFGPIGLLKHGSNAELKEGARMVVYTDAPLTVHHHA
jgi:hypothetical protein